MHGLDTLSFCALLRTLKKRYSCSEYSVVLASSQADGEPLLLFNYRLYSLV